MPPGGYGIEVRRVGVAEGILSQMAAAVGLFGLLGAPFLAVAIIVAVGRIVVKVWRQ